VLLGRFVIFAAVSLGACAHSDDSAARVAVQTESSRPEQVVQRIEPAPSAVQPASADAARAGNEAATHAEPATNGGPTPAPSAARDPRASGQTVTAKHVEAELNRLEAELK